MTNLWSQQSEPQPDTPLISVLMAAYNAEAFIVDAISSLQRQTISQIEIIVVNDGSTDGTLRLANAMSDADCRIHVIDLQPNRGCVEAWNAGLEHCRAPFIARMDADDISIEDRLEKQVTYLEAHPDVALVGGAATSIDRGGHRITLIGVSPIPLDSDEIRRSLLLGPPCYHDCWLARREVYLALGGYRNLFPAEDYDFLLRAVTCGYKLANIPDVILTIRLQPGQVSNQFALRQRKMHGYVIRLYKERRRCGTDTYSQPAARAAVESGKVPMRLHYLAGKCVAQAFMRTRRFEKLFFLVAAALLSPWQARYFIDRFRMRFICRSAGHLGA